MCSPWFRFAGPLGLFLLVSTAIAPPVRADSLREKILDSKYSKGDYALYLGWHDPADWQFDEHASYALPIGVKIRWRWLNSLRLEGDVSYYRRSQGTDLSVSVFKGPEFDSFSVAASLQWAPRVPGPVIPYVGAGPVFVSLGNDFIAFRPKVFEQQPGNPDQRALASWGASDLGWHVLAGLDFPIGLRAFPFVEFRHVFGELTFGPEDVQLGSLSVASIGEQISDLETPPDDPAVGGRPYEGRYDWSGPAVSVGLKIRF